MDIINLLGKNYDLSEKQINILKVLEFKDSTVREISKKTQIPISRLYDYLKKLIDSKLIDKSKKKPCLYSFQNKDDKIYDFIKAKFEDTVKKEALILAALEKSDKEVKLLTSKEDFILQSRRIFSEADEIYSIERKITPPYYFYPEDYEDYKKVRGQVKKKRSLILEKEHLQKFYKDNYFENLKKGKKFFSLTHREAISSFLDTLKKALGPKKFQEHLKTVMNTIEREEIDCRLSKEAFPFYMIITKTFVLITFNAAVNVTGLLIRDKNASRQFLEFFYSVFESADPILPFLKKYVNGGEKK